MCTTPPPINVGVFHNYRLSGNLAIAFDPSKSNHYKLVCVCGYFRLWVFSSESRRNTVSQPWKLAENFGERKQKFGKRTEKEIGNSLNNFSETAQNNGSAKQHSYDVVGSPANCQASNGVVQVFKYQVDVGYVATFYPFFVNDEFAIHLLLTLHEGKEEGEGLVISLPNGKDILWRLQDMSITQLESCNGITQRVYKRGYSTSKHIDTLAFIEPGR
nr:hypothetical protein Iba_chr05dCG2200 [Ipomoea batatas]